MLPAEAALGQPCSYLAGQGTMWTFSMCCMSSLLTSTVGPASWCSDPTRTLKLKEGLESVVDGIADEQGILDNEREDPKVIQGNAVRCYQEKESREDNETEDENSSEKS